MERSNAWAVPAVVRWRTLPIERKLHWLLRVGVVGCFIGHGAYGLLTKEAWVPYFAVEDGHRDAVHHLRLAALRVDRACRELHGSIGVVPPCGHEKIRAWNVVLPSAATNLLSPRCRG